MVGITCRPLPSSTPELMQTEMHHVRTLKIMLCVYVRELKENLQMEPSKLDCLFPRLESLLDLHTNFLSRLKERRRDCLLAPGERNYFINRLADVLIGQVGGTHKHSTHLRTHSLTHSLAHSLCVFCTQKTA